MYENKASRPSLFYSRTIPVELFYVRKRVRKVVNNSCYRGLSRVFVCGESLILVWVTGVEPDITIRGDCPRSPGSLLPTKIPILSHLYPSYTSGNTVLYSSLYFSTPDSLPIRPPVPLLNFQRVTGSARVKLVSLLLQVLTDSSVTFLSLGVHVLLLFSFLFRPSLLPRTRILTVHDYHLYLTTPSTF